jgi:hypothetical protein
MTSISLMYNDIAISNLSRVAKNYHCNLVYHRDVVMVDISVSQGTASCNANVDLLYRVCGETVDCMNEDVYIRIDALEDCTKCRQICWA